MPLSVRVPASTSNLGAGFDCLGLALDLWLEASISDRPGPPLYEGTVSEIDAASDLVLKTIGASVLDGRQLHVRSDIPVGRGLGSSAAALVAGAALGQLIAHQPVDPDGAFELATEVEGHPDNAAAAAFGGLMLMADKPCRLTLHPSLAVALAIPERALETKAARAVLPAEVPRGVAVAQAARAAALVHGLVNGDWDLVRFGMEDQLAVPHRRRLIPGYDAACVAGEVAGACGVTISGAGSTLLAFTSPGDAAQVARLMADALSEAGNPARPLSPAIALRGLTESREQGTGNGER